MILIGLTGSLATGKSTVSALLSSPPYSLPIIDADLLAHRAVLPNTPAYHAILAHFAPTTPDLLLPPTPPSPLRPLNRAALGRRVFGPSAARARDRKILNGIIHPAVRMAMARQVLWCYLRGCWACVLDVPLLYEGGLDCFVAVVVMVAVTDVGVQMRRLRGRDGGLSEGEARDRVGSQMGVGEKVGRTRARGGRRGKVVFNDGGKGELEAGVERVMGEIRGDGGGVLWGWWLWGSPWGAAGVGAWEVYQGWRARRRWEGERAGL